MLASWAVCGTVSAGGYQMTDDTGQSPDWLPTDVPDTAPGPLMQIRVTHKLSVTVDRQLQIGIAITGATEALVPDVGALRDALKTAEMCISLHKERNDHHGTD